MGCHGYQITPVRLFPERQRLRINCAKKNIAEFFFSLLRLAFIIETDSVWLCERITRDGVRSGTVVATQ